MKYLVRGGRLIDGTGGPVLEDVDLLIDESRIAAIQPRGTISSHESQVIDATDKTVLPGLIDVHVHICSLHPWLRPKPWGSGIWAEMALIGARNARLFLDRGITTIRTVGTAGNVDFVLRDAIKDGLIAGPRILAAGQLICMTGGHSYLWGIEVDGVEEMRKVVRQQIKGKANWIKLMVTGGLLSTYGGGRGRPQLTADELHAAIDEAHRAGIKVCGHAEGLQGVNDALAAGMDCIEHGMFMDNEKGLQLLLERGAFLVPTLMAYQLFAEGAGSLKKDEIQSAQAGLKGNQVGFQRAMQAGAKIAMGSDLIDEFGMDVGQGWRELIYMVDNGMSPMQAIVTGTKNGAELLGLSDEIGTLQVGKRADLIVVDGDPLEDIREIGNVKLVLQDGKKVSGSLDAG